jgi:hypothetical protein
LRLASRLIVAHGAGAGINRWDGSFAMRERKGREQGNEGLRD